MLVLPLSLAIDKGEFNNGGGGGGDGGGGHKHQSNKTGSGP